MHVQATDGSTWLTLLTENAESSIQAEGRENSNTNNPPTSGLGQAGRSGETNNKMDLNFMINSEMPSSQPNPDTTPAAAAAGPSTTSTPWPNTDAATIAAAMKNRRYLDGFTHSLYTVCKEILRDAEKKPTLEGNIKNNVSLLEIKQWLEKHKDDPVMTQEIKNTLADWTVVDNILRNSTRNSDDKIVQIFFESVNNDNKNRPFETTIYSETTNRRSVGNRVLDAINKKRSLIFN